MKPTSGARTSASQEAAPVREAREALQSVFNQPVRAWAQQRLNSIERSLLDGSPFAPYMTALLQLRDENVLGTDEVLFLVSDLWIPFIVGASDEDPELKVLREQKDEIEARAAGRRYSEWPRDERMKLAGVSNLEVDRQEILLAAELRRIGAGEIADLNEAKDSAHHWAAGNEAFESRWPEKDSDESDDPIIEEPAEKPTVALPDAAQRA